MPAPPRPTVRNNPLRPVGRGSRYGVASGAPFRRHLWSIQAFNAGRCAPTHLACPADQRHLGRRPTNERWAICARRIVLPPFSMGALIAGIAVQSDQAKFIFGNRTLVPCIVLEHFPMITQPSILNHRSDLALFLREPPRTVLIVSAGRR